MRRLLNIIMKNGNIMISVYFKIGIQFGSNLNSWTGAKGKTVCSTI